MSQRKHQNKENKRKSERQTRHFETNSTPASRPESRRAATQQTFSPSKTYSRTSPHRYTKKSQEGGGGRRSRPSSPQTSGGDASGGFISHQKQRVKPRADPAATRGPDASSTRQYLFIYNHSQISSASRRRRLLRVQRGVNPVRPGQIIF